MTSDIKKPSSAANTVKSRHRLEDIGHHFLSDADERKPAWHNSHFIPVLLGSKNDDHLVYKLERAFNRQQRSSMVLNIEGSLNSSHTLTTKISTRFSAQSINNEGEGKLLPDFFLIPVTSPATTLALQCEHLVITVHASLPGIRIAYNQLSFLASLNTNFRVCVVIYGAKTAKQAQRFFSFLLSNAQSLLELKLESGGYVLQDIGAEENAESGITNVARRIADKFQERKKPLYPSTLKAPSEASIYLS